MDSIHIVILVGFIMTWFLIKMLSDQVRKSRDITMTGMLAASKYIDAKIDKKDKDIHLQIEVDTINKIMAYLELDKKDDNDTIKAKYIRQAVTKPFGREWEG